MKKVALIVVALLVLAVLVSRNFGQKTPDKLTYFSYSAAELALLEPTDSLEINLDDLYLWNQKVFRLVSQNKIGDVDASRIYAYLAVAQRDFASLSYNASGSYRGSIGNISQKVLCALFPDDCTYLSINETADTFSEQISKLVMNHVSERITKDKAAKPFTLRLGKDLWSGLQPSIGIDAMNRIPWHIKSSDQFRVDPPPAISSDTVKEQLKLVQSALANITQQQRADTVFWAGGPGTKTPPGIWLNIADQYTKDMDTKLETVLGLHADITTAMADAVIAVFDSKYAHLLKRPFMLDPKINTVMPTPNHPSFPSGHATISGAAYAVLTHYFPQNKEEWSQSAATAYNTRLWGGIHFPMDNEVGLELGKKVGGQTVEQSK